MTSPIELPGVKGLFTDANLYDQNNDPTSLLDCRNVNANEENYGAARHGHPEVYLDASKYPFSPTSNTRGDSLYSYEYKNSTYFTATYKNSVTNEHGLVYYTLDTSLASTNKDLSDLYAYSGTLPMTTPAVSTKLVSVQGSPQQFQVKDNLFVMTDYGMFMAPANFAYKNAGANANKMRSIVRPVYYNATFATDTDFSNSNNNWMAQGYRVKIKFVLERQTSYTGDERFILGTPSDEYVVTFLNDLSAQQAVHPTQYGYIHYSISGKIDVFSKYNLKVYRTLQYKPGDAIPVDYHLCDTREFATEYSSATTGIISDGKLTLNDDAIFANPEGGLYTNASVFGNKSANLPPLPARNAVSFKGYTFYSDLIQPATGHFFMTGVPVDGDTFSVRLGLGNVDTDLTFKSTPVSATDIPIVGNKTTLSVDSETYLTTTSVTTYPYSNNIENLTYNGISPSAVAVNIFPGIGYGQVPAYAFSFNISTDASTGGVGTLFVKLDNNSVSFDRTKFPDDGGIIALVGPSPNLRVSFLIQYQSILENTSLSQLEFQGCVSNGRPLSDITSVFPANNGAYLYYIPGTSVADLPLYLGNSTVANGAPTNPYYYFSLLPALFRPSYPVAYPKSSYAVTNGAISCQVQYRGPFHRENPELLDLNVSALCNSLNSQTAFQNVAVAFPGVNVGEFYIQSTNPAYEYLYAKSSTGSKYSPVLSTIYDTTSLISTAQEYKNGLGISRILEPESQPLFSQLAPEPVGSDNNRILALAATSESLYAIKENEGIFRIQIRFGTNIPSIQSVTLVDGTVSLVAPESVATIDDSIIFLADQGFIQLHGYRSTFIGRPIAREIRLAISKLRTANQLDTVRSFVNSAKKLYGCYLPLAGNNGKGVTYVYNTRSGHWSKWDLPFDASFVNNVGQLTTLHTDYAFTTLPLTVPQTQTVPTTTDNINSLIQSNIPLFQYLRQDRYTSGDPLNGVDQLDEELKFTTPSLISTFIGMYSVSSSGTAITVSSSGNARPSDNLVNFTTRLVNNQLYYKSGGILYPCTVTQVTGTYSSNTSSITVNLTGLATLPFTPSAADGLYVGVNTSITFMPFAGGSNFTSLKRFSEFNIITYDTVHKPKVSFQTDSQGGFGLETTFDTYANYRTIYRTYVPLNESHGRFLIRKINHDYPGENFRMLAQGIVYRDLQGSRSQKN